MSEAIAVPGSHNIREILAKRVDQQKQAAGIVVGVVEPAGRRVIAYGNLAQNDSRPVTDDAIFEIGSVTKLFTSLLLADMVVRNEVFLEDSIATYLPAHVRTPERNGKSITLLDLATHASGLPRIPGNLRLNDPANPYAGYTADDLYEFLSSYKLPRDPGAEFEYSNLGAGLLGHVLALRAGTDFESLIRSRITQPLDMSDTAIELSPSMAHRLATGHNALLAPVTYWSLPTLAGAGALRSSANDMLTLLEAVLGYKESSLGPAVKAVLQPRRPAGQMKIGLAWLITGETFWHNGGTGGFRSFLACQPKSGIGAVVLSNASTPNGVDDIGFHLLNPKAPLAELKAPEPLRHHTAVRIDPQFLDLYIGRYQILPNMILEITRDGDRLIAQTFAQNIAAPKFELFAEGEKNFFSTAGHEIAFETASDCRATSLTLRPAGRPSMTGTRLS